MTHEQTSTLMTCLRRGSRSPKFTMNFHSALSFRATFGLMNCICVRHTDSTSSSSAAACRLYRALGSFCCVVNSSWGRSYGFALGRVFECRLDADVEEGNMGFQLVTGGGGGGGGGGRL